MSTTALQRGLTFQIPFGQYYSAALATEEARSRIEYRETLEKQKKFQINSMLDDSFRVENYKVYPSEHIYKQIKDDIKPHIETVENLILKHGSLYEAMLSDEGSMKLMEAKRNIANSTIKKKHELAMNNLKTLSEDLKDPDKSNRISKKTLNDYKSYTETGYNTEGDNFFDYALKLSPEAVTKVEDEIVSKMSGQYVTLADGRLSKFSPEQLANVVEQLYTGSDYKNYYDDIYEDFPDDEKERNTPKMIAYKNISTRHLGGVSPLERKRLYDQGKITRSQAALEELTNVDDLWTQEILGVPEGEGIHKGKIFNEILTDKGTANINKLFVEGLEGPIRIGNSITNFSGRHKYIDENTIGLEANILLKESDAERILGIDVGAMWDTIDESFANSIRSGVKHPKLKGDFVEIRGWLPIDKFDKTVNSLYNERTRMKGKSYPFGGEGIFVNEEELTIQLPSGKIVEAGTREELIRALEILKEEGE